MTQGYVDIFFKFLPYLAVIYGLLIGSFLTVCIHRIPHGRTKGLASLEEDETNLPETNEKLSIFFPIRSFCPNCKNQISWWMNIPLFSWLFLGGKCFHCKEKISARYPVIEILSAFFCFMSYTQFSLLTGTVVYIFCCALIVISFIDLDYYIIPNSITYPGMVIGIVLAFLNQFYPTFAFPLVPDLKSAGLGLLMGGGFLWMVSAIYKLVRKREGLGFGDVKLMAMVGLLFGPEAALISIMLGSLLGSFLGGVFLIFSRKNLGRPLPFGPFLALGCLAFIFITPHLHKLVPANVVI